MNLPEPALIFLIGAAGSGKSTWASGRYLAEEVVSSDRLRAVVGSGESDIEASADAFSLLRRIVSARLGRRLTTVVDTLGLDDDLRAECLEQATAADMPAVAVVLATPLQICRTRNQERVRPVPAKVLDGQHRRVRSISSQLDGEAWSQVVVVDGSGDAPPKVVSPASVTARGEAEQSWGPDFVLHLSRFVWDGPLGTRLAEIAVAAEEAGFTGISVMDHLVQIPQVGRAWEDIPEPFTALAFLAGVTETIELGTLVANATLRNLGLVAKTVASLDALSDGRAFCGIGAGWNESEELAYGYPPTTVGARMDRLEDAAVLLPRMWGRGTVTHHGVTTVVRGAMTYPRPVRDHIRLIVGGGGERRTLRIAAAHADAVNISGGPDVVVQKRAVLDRHCEQVGRDPAEVEMTVLDLALVGDDRRMVADLVEAHRGRSNAAAYRRRVGAGTADELVDRYRRLGEVGVGTVFVGLPNLTGTGPVERFASIIAELRRRPPSSRSDVERQIATTEPPQGT